MNKRKEEREGGQEIRRKKGKETRKENKGKEREANKLMQSGVRSFYHVLP